MRYQSKPVDSMPLIASEDTFKEKTQTNTPHHPTSTDDPQEATLEYNVALACSLDEVKAFSIDSFVIAETEKEKSPLNSWVKSRGSNDISTVLSTPILVNEPKTLLYQFAGSKKTALSYDNVLPVKKGSAVYRDVFIPVKPSVQADERLGWPTEGYFYHFVDDELTHEYKIEGNNKWGFNVTESTKEGLSDEIIVSKPQSTILLPYKIDNQVIARQHLLYRKEKLSQDLLLDDISAEWLDEYACPLDMDVVFSTRTVSILEKEKSQDGKTIYVIKNGDSLSKVAYRQGITLDELLSLNPRYKDSPDRVNVGDEIIIEVTESYNVEPEYHTCQLDTKTNLRETWSSIAALYNISAKSLLGMNPDYDADPSALSLGDKLQVTLPKESSGQSSVRSALPAEDVTTSKTAFAHSNVQCEVSSKTHCNVHPIVGDSGADKNTTVVKVKQLILRSEPLSTSDTLELLASGGGEALSKGSKGVEVKAIQKSLIDLGFDLGPAGAGADGDFGKATESAIKQFQKAYEPTHTTHKIYEIGEVDGVVDKNTILALDESVHENWQYIDDEMDEKWLTVPKGQLTFGNEGNDSADSIYFTRVPHVPNAKGVVIGESGITLGRGLDLGSRNQGDVEQIFSNVSINCKPISHSLLEWLKKGAGLRGQKAYDHYKTLDSQVPELEQELTRKQQHFLFLEIYPFYEKETERLLTKSDVRSFYDKESVITWRELPRNIREVLVDITYRGDNRSSSRKRIVPSLVADVNDKLSGSVSNFYLLMKDAKFWVDDFKVDNNRYEARYKALLT